MSTSTEQTSRNKLYKVIAKDANKVVAEYVFARARAALDFRLGMIQKGYTAELIRTDLKDL